MLTLSIQSMLLWLLFFRRYLDAPKHSTVFNIVMDKVGTCQLGYPIDRLKALADLT